MKHLVRNALIIFFIILLMYLFTLYVLPYIMPFVIAVLLAVIIEPVISFLQKKARLPRAPAVALSLIIIIGSLGTIIVFFFVRLIAELIEFSASLPRYTGLLAREIAELRQDAESFYFSLPVSVMEFIANNLGTIEENVGSYLNQLQAFTKDLLNYLINFISSVPGVLFIIFVSIVATFFMAKDRNMLRQFWLDVLPKPWGEKSLQVTKDLLVAAMSYAKAQLILISITFSETLVGLLIIDAPYALLMAVLVGIFDLLPVLGPSAVFLPWIIWEFIKENMLFALKLGVLYIVVLVVRQMLEAKIIGNAMGLHPLATLISIYVGFQVLGVAGLVAGPLFLIGLKALLRAGVINWPRN